MCKWLCYNNDCVTEDLRLLRVAKQQLRHGEGAKGDLSFFFESVWEQASPCRRQAEPRLSLDLWRVKKDGAEG